MARYAVAVCCDLEKHSEAWWRIPRDSMVALIGEYKHLAEKHASDFGRLHSNFTGDGHLFLFEDADAAVRFALRLVAQWGAAFRELPALQDKEPLPLRVGVHYGDETELDEGGAWVGRCGNLAKRIEGEAEPDSVYVSEGLLDLMDFALYTVEPVGPRSLKGDHLEKRMLYRVDDFDDQRFSQKPPPELAAKDWFIKGVAMIGTPEEDSDAEAECYTEALRLRPDYPEAHYNYAILLGNRGDLEGAEEHNKEVLRLRPDEPAAHNNYAILLGNRGDLEGAEDHYKEALRLRPDFPEVHVNYGVLLEKRGDLQGAEEHYKEAFRLRPDYPDAHNNYGLLLKNRGDLQGAEEHYKEALRLRPDFPEVHDNYGVLLQERGDFEEGEEHYKEAFRLRPDNPKAHNNYGILLKKRGDPEEAEGHYKEALRLSPDYPDAHYNYALLLRGQGHPRKAKRHLEEAFRLDPEDPQIRAAFEGRAWRTPRPDKP